jgi:iron(III) transport system substrate-binding protein
LVLLVTLLAGCRGGDLDELTVYSGRSEELVGPLVAAFEEESGIRMSVRYGSSSEMAATLLAEGNGSPADLFLSQDPASMGAVTEMMAPLSDGLLTRVPERFRDREGSWVGITARSRVLAYNPELVPAADLPASYRDLIGPEWSGRVAIAPTNASFIAFVAAMVLLDGEEATAAWLAGMAANEPMEYEGNAPIAAAVDAGDAAVGLINHYYLLELGAEQGGTTARNYFFPGPDAGSLVMPSAGGILASAANPEAASAFLEFLLSAESQTYFSEVVFEYPVIGDAEPPAGAPPLESLRSPDLAAADLASVLDIATDLITAAGLL